MSEIKYIVSQGSPADVSSFEIIDSKDGQIVDQTVIQNKFNPQTDKVEAHFYSLDGTLLQSFRDFTEFVIPRGKIGRDQDIVEINLDPEKDTIRAGFTNGDVYIIYNFLRRALKTENSRETNLFIDAISPDRTEIRAVLAKGSQRDTDLTTAATLLKERIGTSEFLEQFVLNFSNNRLLVGVNIDTTVVAGVAGIVVKLYQPLPDDFEIKDLFTLEEIVSDSVLFEVESEVTIQPTVLPSLRGPNFDASDAEDDSNPTEFLTLSQLVPENSLSRVQGLLQEKGIELGIDYDNFENFIFFSSAKERIENFLFKTELITSASGDDVKIQNIINKFDHYERYLYFTDELQNEDENTQNTYIEEAELYDELNFNKLTNSIPSYIVEDSRNLPYLLFVDMVAQHFDNIWIYADSLTDRYKADNRLDFGISKDLVKEAVENLGINLYKSNKSVESLFSIFEGETYVSGSEIISGSVKQFSEPLQPISKNDYLKEIYKRVYHNVPLLLKSKGTERGLRSLINCFGIPDNILDIQVYENTPLSFNRPNQTLDFTTSSLDRIRLQPTGSLVEDDILSINTRIQTYDTIYDENLSTVEIGFSPTDNVNNFISGSVESIDNLIGDPSDYTRTSYNSVQVKAIQVLGETKPYNVQEFIRLIKFYDNALFRIVQEFIPARTDLVSGIVIKPHLLERSKRKGTTAEWVKFFTNRNPEAPMDFEGSEYGKNFQLEGDIQTAETLGQDAGAIPKEYTTSYDSSTDLGTQNEQARFTGEFNNSKLIVSRTDVSARNRFKPTSKQTMDTDKFVGSDYDTALNNVQQSRTSTFRKDSANTQNAAVQDSNYTDTGLTNARYNGSVAKPTFRAASLVSDIADYPILRLQTVEAVTFDTIADARVIEQLREVPIDQLNVEKIFFSTFSRTTDQVGLRQIEPNSKILDSENFLSGSTTEPSSQTFVFTELDTNLEKISNKRLFFIQDDFIGDTDENGKIISFLPRIPKTRVFLTVSGSAQMVCSSSVFTQEEEYFISPSVTRLVNQDLIGKVIYTDRSLKETADLVSGSFYGVSFSPNNTVNTFVKVDENAKITEVTLCSSLITKSIIYLSAATASSADTATLCTGSTSTTPSFISPAITNFSLSGLVGREVFTDEELTTPFTGSSVYRSIALDSEAVGLGIVLITNEGKISSVASCNAGITILDGGGVGDGGAGAGLLPEINEGESGEFELGGGLT